jgi:hypothetical protein
MSDLNELCSTLVNDVNDAIGASVVDLETGLLLGVAHNVPYFTQSYLDAVAAAAVEMFRGKTVSTVEELLANNRGNEVRNSIQEIQMTTSNTFHFMSQVPDKPNALLILITTRKANLGMGWSALRSALPKATPLCP